VQVQNSAARLLATLTASHPPAVLHIAQGVGVDLLLQLLRSQACSNAAQGNMALCIGDLARQPALLPALRRKDAVKPLLGEDSMWPVIVANVCILFSFCWPHCSWT